MATASCSLVDEYGLKAFLRTEVREEAEYWAKEYWNEAFVCKGGDKLVECLKEAAVKTHRYEGALRFQSPEVLCDCNIPPDAIISE